MLLFNSGRRLKYKSKYKSKKENVDRKRRNLCSHDIRRISTKKIVMCIYIFTRCAQRTEAIGMIRFVQGK